MIILDIPAASESDVVAAAIELACASSIFECGMTEASSPGSIDSGSSTPVNPPAPVSDPCIFTNCSLTHLPEMRQSQAQTLRDDGELSNGQSRPAHVAKPKASGERAGARNTSGAPTAVERAARGWSAKAGASTATIPLAPERAPHPPHGQTARPAPIQVRVNLVKASAACQIYLLRSTPHAPLQRGMFLEIVISNTDAPDILCYVLAIRDISSAWAEAVVHPPSPYHSTMYIRFPCHHLAAASAIPAWTAAMAKHLQRGPLDSHTPSRAQAEHQPSHLHRISTAISRIAHDHVQLRLLPFDESHA